MSNKFSVGKETIPIFDKELIIDRVFDAPNELLWRAWTDPNMLAQWWGPKGYAILITKFDLKPGGIFHYGMRSPSGQEMWGRFVFSQIQEPEKLVFINSFSDKPGGVIRNPMNLTWPLEVLNIYTFINKGSQTTLHMVSMPHNATEIEQKTFSDNRENIGKGIAGTFEQLDQYLSRLIESP